MPSKWRDTVWKQLPNGSSVNVVRGEEIAIVSVHFTDADELPRDFPLALNGRVIDHVEINGVRYVQAPEYHESCEVLD